MKLERAGGETIAALATSPAPSGLAVIRVSGPLAAHILTLVFSSQTSPYTHPHRLCFGSVKDPDSGAVLDKALAVYFPTPHSYTGEDTIELQIHGSPLLAERILAMLYRHGASPADPGEFTKRAFLNGKLDLTQAEAIADMIGATSERALQIATEQLCGKLSTTLEFLGNPLRLLLAELEAALDFADEQVPEPNFHNLVERIDQLTNHANNLAASCEYGEQIRSGLRVLLCGPPNAGKSSLLNALLGADRAIVTDIPGTTRDNIEAGFSIDGYRFVLCDSAGLTNSSDTVEQIGVARTRDRVKWAELVLFVFDLNSDNSWWESCKEIASQAAHLIFVGNKIDLDPNTTPDLPLNRTYQAISAKTGTGLVELQQLLVSHIESQNSGISQVNTAITNRRQQHCLQECSQALQGARLACQQGLPLEIVCAELRAALGALSELVGVTTDEDVLDRIFSTFCIGK